MKTNRRNFLKGGLGGIFGMVLTWAGVVRAEEPEPLMLSDDEKRQAFDGSLADHFSEEGSFSFWLPELPNLRPLWPIDEATYPAITNRDLAGFDGVNDWCDWPPVIHGAPTYEDQEPLVVQVTIEQEAEQPQDWWTQGTTWFVDLVDGDDANDGLSPEMSLLTRQEALSRCTEEPTDFVLVFPGDGTVETILDPSPHRGMVWSDIGSGFGHWVHWANDGSDEDGDGRHERPVATEACAQSMADNPLFRV